MISAPGGSSGTQIERDKGGPNDTGKPQRFNNGLLGIIIHFISCSGTTPGHGFTFGTDANGFITTKDRTQLFFD
jgi:hypothetical protein